MPRYKVLMHTWIGGRPYDKDAVADLSDDYAKGLVKAGLIEEIKEGEGEKAAPADAKSDDTSDEGHKAAQSKAKPKGK